MHDALIRELAEAAVEHAATRATRSMGPVDGRAGGRRAGQARRFTVSSRMVEPKAQGALVLPSGERRMLGDVPFRFGRMPENDLVLADPNVSRQHAEIRPDRHPTSSSWTSVRPTARR